MITKSHTHSTCHWGEVSSSNDMYIVQSTKPMRANHTTYRNHEDNLINTVQARSQMNQMQSYWPLHTFMTYSSAASDFDDIHSPKANLVSLAELFVASTTGFTTGLAVSGAEVLVLKAAD